MFTTAEVKERSISTESKRTESKREGQTQAMQAFSHASRLGSDRIVSVDFFVIEERKQTCSEKTIGRNLPSYVQ